MELNKIYNVDCYEFMKTVPDKFFDLIVTDPPYGLDIHKKNVSRGKLAKARDYGVCDWDKSIPDKKYFDEMFRISKNQIIFGGNYFIEFLKNSSCWIVWDKDNGETDFADCELAWTSFNSAVRKFKFKWQGMLQENMSWKETRYHPTQKPVPLGRWILDKYATNEFKIFDPYAGSGTFLIAAKNKGLSFVGCEISKEYCEIANKRLSQENLKSWF